MAFYVGRVGLPTASGGDGLTFLEPTEWSQSGQTVSLSGIQGGMTEVQLLWWRDQMLGLVDEIGEPVIPVRSSVVSAFDGYYLIRGVRVSHPAGSLNGGYLHAEWGLDLERVITWKQPRAELVAAWGQLSNGYGVTGALVTAVPPSVVDWTVGAAGSFTYLTRSSGDAVSVNVAVNTSPGTSGTFTGRYLGDLTNHYLAGCRHEYDANNDGTYRQIVGRRAIESTTNLTKVRLGNGLVRVTITNSGQDISVSHWDGSAWDTAVPVQLYYMSTSQVVQIQRAAVLHNTPELCVLRCFCTLVGGSLSNGSFQVDLSVRRGMRAVFVRAIRSGQWRMQFASVTASTALTGGIRETSNNSGGNRVVLTSQDGSTFDTFNGRISQTGSTSQFLAAVTCEIGGSGATGQDAAQNQLNETFVLCTETQRMVQF